MSYTWWEIFMYFACINGIPSPGTVLHNAACKGNIIIIRISIKTLFKSYLLIETIPVTPQFWCGQSFVSKKEKGPHKFSRNRNHFQSVISTCTFQPTQLGNCRNTSICEEFKLAILLERYIQAPWFNTDIRLVSFLRLMFTVFLWCLYLH